MFANAVVILLVILVIVVFGIGIRMINKFLRMADYSAAAREREIERLLKSKTPMTLHQFAALKERKNDLRVEKKLIETQL